MTNNQRSEADKISVSIINGSNANETGRIDEVIQVTLTEFADIVTRTNWCPGVFHADENRFMRRNNRNLSRMNLLVLDVDEGCTLEKAKTIFKDYTCIIGTTRNHQKVKIKKSGKTESACDRFRVILFLDGELCSDSDFKDTWFAANEKWSFIDPACKDAARFFYPCTEIVFLNPTGAFFPVRAAQPDDTPSRLDSGALTVGSSNPQERGRLSWRTQDFLLNGAEPWHHRYFLACVDLKEQGYTHEEARSLLERATEQHLGYLDDEDERQLNDVYQNHVSKYPPRSPIREEDSRDHDAPCFSARLNEREYAGSSIEQRMQKIEREKVIRVQALKNQVPFVSEAFDGVFSLKMGLNMIGACTGGGKTTTAANILARFFQHHRDKQALVISNEETTEDVIKRIACTLLEVNFLKYRRDDLPEAIIEAVERMSEKVALRIEVVDKEQDWDMTCIEDVQAVLEYALRPDKNFGLVIVDYLQTIAFSRTRDDKSVEVSKRLGLYLKDYGRRVPMPVVVFGQLHPNPQGTMEFSERFQNDRTIVNHAVAAIEVIPDYQNRQATFIIHKDRFGDLQKVKVQVSYREGRYIRLVESSVFPLPVITSKETSGA